MHVRVRKEAVTSVKCLYSGTAALNETWHTAARAVSSALQDTARALGLVALLRRGHILFCIPHFSGLKHCD